MNSNKYHLATSAWSNVTVLDGSVVKATCMIRTGTATAMNILRSPWTEGCRKTLGLKTSV